MEAGIKNVVNTSCPTLWSLNQEHCVTINQKKSRDVVTTLTFYNKDRSKDRYLINKLLESYRYVYVWIQGIEDLPYLKSLDVKMTNIIIVPPTLDAYDELLVNCEIDYIGTRLHAGVRALQHKVRAQIVAVDNRAIEIGKDVNLNVISRDHVESVMDFIAHDYETKLSLPRDNIQAWFQSAQQAFA